MKNSLTKLLRRKNKAQLITVKSYMKGFANSINNYENMIIEDEITHLLSTRNTIK
ncbi:MAG: hypothetical protein AAGI07_06680 [Bacteroidota bacterium]